MKNSVLALLLALALMVTILPATAENDIVELRAVASLHSQTLDLETLPIYQEIAEKAGVHITWEYYRTDYDVKKQLMLADAEALPDFFFGRYSLNVSDIQQNIGLFIPLEDLVEEYCPNIQKMYEQYPETKTLNVFPDGHTYSLAHYMPDRPAHYGSLFINQKWLDALGLDMPTTIEELTEVARRFAEDDPNGNGEKDEIAVALNGYSDANFGGRAFIGSFGVHDSIDSWRALDEDGNVVYNPATENFKDFVEWLNTLYTEGLLDQEFLTQEYSQYKAKTRRTTDAIVGIQCGWSLETIGNEDYTMLLPPEGPNGDRYIAGSNFVNKLGTSYATFSITTACKNPEAVMKWVDYFFTDEYGYQSYYGAYGVALQVNEDGTISRIAPEGQSLDIWNWTNAMNDAFVGYVSPEVEEKIVHDDKWYAIGMGKMDFDKAYQPYMDQSFNYPVIILENDDATTVAAIETDLNSIRDIYVARWITEGGIEEEWAEYLDKLESAGLSTYLSIYQDAYDAVY